MNWGSQNQQGFHAADASFPGFVANLRIFFSIGWAKTTKDVILVGSKL